MENMDAIEPMPENVRDVSVDVTSAEPKEPELQPETESHVEPLVQPQTEAEVVEKQEVDNVDVDTPTHPKVDSLETVCMSQEQETTTTATATSSPSPLVNLFVSILKAQNPDVNLNLNLNKEMTDCLLFILNTHPDYFSDFGKLLSLILEDGKINMNDISYINLLVSKTYEFVHHFKKNIKNMNDEKTFEVCANIMKIVFHVLVMKNVIDVKHENKEVLVSTFDSIVDSCVHLVKLTHVLNHKGCTCFSFFKSSKSSSSSSKPKSE